jgi:type IV pilus assembly protein PilC
MPKYSYQARDSRGEIVNGQVTASSTDEAAKMLRGEGKFIVRLAEGGAVVAKDDPGASQTGKRIRHEDVIFFTHQMAIMLQTGVSLSEALDAVSQQATNRNFQIVLEDVNATVQAGSNFSQALAKHPRVFPHVMTSLLRASEASGTMGQMLDRISLYLTKEHQTIRKIKGALTYPAFMLLVALSVTTFLVFFVMPRFAKIYEGRGATLPLPTQLLLSVSEIGITYWYVWLLLIGAAVGSITWMRRTELGRRFIDHMKIRTPIIGPMFTQLYVCRAMQTMGTMVSAGVPMLDMIAITRDVTNNVHYQRLWDQVDERLRHGSQLSDPLFESPLIPRSIARMVASGEKAGRLGQVMNQIAVFTESDLDESVKKATQFIEPLMVSVMGVVIGGVAISLLLPIFTVGRVMAGK